MSTERTPLPQLPEDGDFEDRHPATGKLRTRVTFAAGEPVGLWLHYFADGQVCREDGFADARYQGPMRVYFPDGTPKMLGQCEKGSRVGDWQWFHPDGSKKLEGSYNSEGVREGWWRWTAPDGTPTTTILFEPNAQDDERHPHKRLTYLRSHGPGVPSMERVDNDDGTHVERRYHKNGQLESETTFHGDSGGFCGYSDNTFEPYARRHGPVREFHEDGSPKLEGAHRNGELEGEVVTWTESGERKVVQYEAGAPVLSEKKLAKLAQKMARKKDAYDKMEMIERAKVDYGHRAGTLWQLVRRGLVAIAEEPELWEKLDNGTGTGEDMVALLSKLPERRKPFPELWTTDLDRLVCEVYSRDPEPLDRAWQDFPHPAQRGMKLVLRRFGKEVDRKDDRYFLGQFSKQEADYPETYRALVVDGELQTMARVRDEKYRPTERYWQFVELFTTREKWAAALRKQLPKTKYPRPSRPEMFLGVDSREELCELLGKLEDRRRTDDALEVLDGREDPAANLAWIVGTSEGPVVRAAAALVATERASEEPPAELWQGLDLTAAAGPARERLARTLARLPEATREALAGSLLEDGKPDSLALVCSLPDSPGLWQRAVAAAGERLARGLDLELVTALSRVGRAGLPLLAELQQGADSEALKQALSLSALLALAEAARAETPWEERFDRLVQCHGWPDDEELWTKTIRPAFVAAMRALPRPRRAARLSELLAAEPGWWRALPALGDAPAGEVLDRLFTRLLEQGVPEQGKQPIAEALDAVDFRIYPFVRWALANDPPPPLLALLREVFDGQEVLEPDLAALGQAPAEQPAPDREPEPDPSVQRLSRILELAATHPADAAARARIYLTRQLPEAGAGYNQVGGVPAGFTEESWPCRDEDGEPEPMDFLISLDLATVPELQSDYPGARALALFISSANSHEAYSPDSDHCQLLPLTEEQLAQPRLAEGQGLPLTEKRFELVPVDVPVGVFTGDAELSELRKLIYQHEGRVLGEPLWLQDEEHWGELIMQFDEALVPMNLGDMGVMYVFADAQFFQCS